MAADLALQRIYEAQAHLDRITPLEKKGVDGVGKLKKRIQAEINFLQKGLQNPEDLKEKDVQCSNLGQLGALCEIAVAVPDVTGILQSFRNKDSERIVVDVVGDNGITWIKVIMRNPKALHLAYMLGSIRSLSEVAEEFIMCAQLHPVFYSPPKVIFWFCNGVSKGLARSIEEKGAAVKGSRIADQDLGLPDFSIVDSDTETEDSSSVSSCSDPCEEKEMARFDNRKEDTIQREVDRPSFSKAERASVISNLTISDESDLSPQENADSGFVDDNTVNMNKTNVQRNSGYDREKLAPVNLDVTAMIAYVSATANGGANLIFEDKFLNEQAACERKSPVKKTLEEYFEGRELLACREAVSRFQEIVSVIGGEGEKARSKELLGRLRVVPGHDSFKDTLQLGGKIRALPRITFGTSQALRAITVTSNMGFVRAAKSQGVKLAVLVHKPRALTEAKEVSATPLEDI